MASLTCAGLPIWGIDVVQRTASWRVRPVPSHNGRGWLSWFGWCWSAGLVGSRTQIGTGQLAG